MSKLLVGLRTCIGVILILYYGAPFLIPVTLGFFFGFLLVKIKDLLRMKGVGNTLANGLVIGFFILLLFFIFYGGGLFVTYIQNHRSSLQESSRSGLDEMTQLLLSTQLITEQDIASVFNELSNLFSVDTVQQLIGGSLGFLTDLLLVVVFTICVVIYYKKISDMMQEYLGDRGRALLEIAKSTIYGYVKGLIVLMLIVGSLYSIGMLIFQVPYGIAIAMIASAMTLVPTVGTFLGVVTAVVLTAFLTKSIWISLMIAIWFQLVQLGEEYFILPKVVGKRANLNVFATILSLLFRGVVWGIPGIFLAVPLTGLLQKILKHQNIPLHIALSD